MDAYQDINPLFAKPRPYVAADQTQPTTCGEKPRQTLPPKPPAAIRNLISELGLRYRPGNDADLEAHTAQLALLSRDLADMPANYLSAAIERWAKQSHFMPKASDLIQLARDIQIGVTPQKMADDQYWQTKCDEQNAKRSTDREIHPALRDEAQWVPVHGGGMRLAWKSEFAPSRWDGPQW
jgi:hypothetical protein